jgi:hypothetical protein
MNRPLESCRGPPEKVEIFANRSLTARRTEGTAVTAIPSEGGLTGGGDLAKKH